MRANIIAIPADRIADWDSFHSVFAEGLGFPDHYGRNLNSWIDCLTYADDEHAGMVSHPVGRGELLVLRLDKASEFEKRCPQQYMALRDACAFVNFRRAEAGGEPVVALLPVG